MDIKGSAWLAEDPAVAYPRILAALAAMQGFGDNRVA
jgi:hypothetical protein